MLSSKAEGASAAAVHSWQAHAQLWSTREAQRRCKPGKHMLNFPALRASAATVQSWQAHAQPWSAQGHRSGGAKLASAATRGPRGARAPAEAHERRAVRHEAGAAHRCQRPAVGGEQLAAHLHGAHSGPYERSASSAGRGFASAQAGHLVGCLFVCAVETSKVRLTCQHSAAAPVPRPATQQRHAQLAMLQVQTVRRLGTLSSRRTSHVQGSARPSWQEAPGAERQLP